MRAPYPPRTSFARAATIITCCRWQAGQRDRVCVNPATRELTRYDNSKAPERE
jgi:hypothetical protein